MAPASLSAVHFVVDRGTDGCSVTTMAGGWVVGDHVSVRVDNLIQPSGVVSVPFGGDVQFSIRTPSAIDGYWTSANSHIVTVDR